MPQLQEKIEQKNSINYFAKTYSKKEEYGKKEFLDNLYPTISADSAKKRNSGMVCCLVKETDIKNADENKQHVFSYANESIENIYTFSKKLFPSIKRNIVQPSIYVSLNEFKNYQRANKKYKHPEKNIYAHRNKKNLYALNSIFIDIDIHNYDSDIELAKTQKTIIEALNTAFNNGEVAVPTLILNSGRGFGIFYVLKDPIANIDKTKTIRYVFSEIYSQLIEKYSLLLNGINCDVDKNVTDVSRICRLPGSFNYHANRYCTLYHMENRKHFTLDEIKEGCHLIGYKKHTNKIHKELNKTKTSIKANKVVSFDNYRLTAVMQKRIDTFAKIVELKQSQNKLEGYRELICFLLYNSLITAKTEKDIAKQLVLDFSDRYFSDSMHKEVEQNAFASVDNHGIYKYSNKKISEILSLSKEDCNATGLGVRIREIERKEARERKLKRNTIILECYQNEKYKNKIELLKIVNAKLEESELNPISRKTFYRVLGDLNNKKIPENVSNKKVCQNRPYIDCIVPCNSSSDIIPNTHTNTSKVMDKEEEVLVHIDIDSPSQMVNSTQSIPEGGFQVHPLSYFNDAIYIQANTETSDRGDFGLSEWDWSSENFKKVLSLKKYCKKHCLIAGFNKLLLLRIASADVYCAVNELILDLALMPKRSKATQSILKEFFNSIIDIQDQPADEFLPQISAYNQLSIMVDTLFDAV